jgi:Rad52/22 family double-strand break repair protein
MSKEKDLTTRTKRAQAFAAMGLVKRQSDHFVVGPTALNGQATRHKVWRNELHKVLCTCEEFARGSVAEPGFRCEHILAVKFSLSGPAPDSPAPTSLPAAEGPPQGGPPQASEDFANHRKEDMPTPVTPVTPVTGPAAASPAAPNSFQQILAELSRPISGDLIKRREGWRDRRGEAHFVDYIEWHTVADLLDEVAADWSHAVRSIVQIGDHVAVTAAITVGGVTREGVGTGTAETETGIKKAEHDALKRAAVKFGIARDLYRHAEEADPEAAPLPKDPLAKTLADLITPKQLVAIKAIANTQGLQAEEECFSLYGCKLDELSRRAASALIDHLKMQSRAEKPAAEPLRQAG